MQSHFDGVDGEDEVSVAGLTSAMTDGDETAFRRFHALYWERIYAWQLVATRGDESLSEELTQKTMIKAARNIRSIPNENELWAWLRTIARNLFLDACRSRSRRPLIVGLDPGNESPSVSAGDPDRRMIELLEECIRELDPGDRHLVERIYLDGDDRAKTAMELNLTYKGLDSRLVRMRAQLRRMMLLKLRHEER